jgi:hypothetical protein
MDNGPFIDDKHDDLPFLKAMVFHRQLKEPESACKYIQIGQDIT